MRSIIRRGVYGLLLGLVVITTQAGLIAQTGDRRITRNSATSRRLALVIGNNAYKSAPLKNPINDATAIARALREEGFIVTELTDVSLRQFRRSVDAFAASLQRDDLALFYYAGHGVQVEGENYLLPVDYEAVDQADVKYEAYSANQVHDKMAVARVKLLILDACRDNPFVATRSSARGLAQMNAQGSLIAFATGPGQTASDNVQGSNGLFTEHLLRSLRRPGLTLSDLFRTVRQAVHDATSGRQSPWVFDNLIGDFALREASEPAGSRPVAPTDDAATLALRTELALWESIKDSRSASTLEDYLRQYPQGRFQAAARERIAALTVPERPAPRADPVRPPTAIERPRDERSLLGYVPVTSGVAAPGSAGKDVVYVATPPAGVFEMLRLAGVGPNDIVYDLGSGDGRIPIMAAKHFGARGVGIEYTPELNAIAQQNARTAGVADRVTFRTEDLFRTDLRGATVITMFLLPSINATLAPKLRGLAPGTRIVTNTFTIDGWTPSDIVTLQDCTSWCTYNLYTVPRR